jgi:serine protease
MRRRYFCGAIVGVLATAAALATAWSATAGRPAILAHSSMKLAKPSVMRIFHGKPARPGGGGGKNLFYHGGVNGIGVETAPKVYLVLWGSHWNSDPAGESGVLTNFLGGVGGSGWLNSVTQYCQGIASGSSTCGTSGHAGNPTRILTGSWSDGSIAPSQPSQSDLAAEAVRAAAHFTNTGLGSNNSTQYVIATAHGNNASGFGTSYCAWHSSTSSSYGNIAYTNLPYITDAGTACGQDFNGLGPNAGITIVEGHELAETITDQFPNGGWLDRQGAENGDKCAWNSATSNQTMGGSSFPVQPLWSNASSTCVLSY